MLPTEAPGTHKSLQQIEGLVEGNRLFLLQTLPVNLILLRQSLTKSIHLVIS